VIVAHWLCNTTPRENRSRITSIGDVELERGDLVFLEALVVGSYSGNNKGSHSSAARRVIGIVWVCERWS
jgi:hypothetical protein